MFLLRVILVNLVVSACNQRKKIIHSNINVSFFIFLENIFCLHYLSSGALCLTSYPFLSKHHHFSFDLLTQLKLLFSFALIHSFPTTSFLTFQPTHIHHHQHTIPNCIKSFVSTQNHLHFCSHHHNPPHTHPVVLPLTLSLRPYQIQRPLLFNPGLPIPSLKYFSVKPNCLHLPQFLSPGLSMQSFSLLSFSASLTLVNTYFFISRIFNTVALNLFQFMHPLQISCQFSQPLKC